MKKVILVASGLMIIINVVLSLILETYSVPVMIQGCAVVIVGAVMLLLAQLPKLSDAYRYSLTALFSVTTIGEWVVSFFAPRVVSNNWFVIVAIALFVFEVSLLVASNFISNINLKNK